METIVDECLTETDSFIEKLSEKTNPAKNQQQYQKSENTEWMNEIRNSITTIEELSKHIELTEDEKIEGNLMKLRITPYYLDILKENLFLRKTIIPNIRQFDILDCENADPLEETKYNKTKCIVHHYLDKCLFLVSNFCSVNCQFCTRSRIFNNSAISKSDIDDGLRYISDNENIRDIILSGGDPILLSDSKLKYILDGLKEIKHIEITRIGTKALVACPSRFTSSLLNILKNHTTPIFISGHFTHPCEINDSCKKACFDLADNGIILRSQTVLLSGVNDNIETIRQLMHKLLTVKVSPYYLYYPDYVVGSAQFRPSIDTGIDIIRQLRETSGLANLMLVVDSKYGKVYLSPQTIIENNENYIKLRANGGEILELKK